MRDVVREDVALSRATLGLSAWRSSRAKGLNALRKSHPVALGSYSYLKRPDGWVKRARQARQRAL